MMSEKPSEAEQKFNKDELAMYEQCLGQCGTAISRMALKNVRKALKTMLASGAKINNSKVAQFIQNIDNSDLFESTEKGSTPPKQQSISNNRNLKKFIAFYVIEQDRRIGHKSVSKKNVATTGNNSSVFPIDTSLDAKTRAYIRMLELKLSATEAEKKNLTAQLEEKSKVQPISIGLSQKNTNEKGVPALEIVTEESQTEVMLRQVMSKIASLPAKFPADFQEQSKGDKTVLKVGSRGEFLFKSKEWEFITQFAAGDNHE